MFQCFSVVGKLWLLGSPFVEYGYLWLRSASHWAFRARTRCSADSIVSSKKTYVVKVGFGFLNKKIGTGCCFFFSITTDNDWLGHGPRASLTSRIAVGWIAKHNGPVVPHDANLVQPSCFILIFTGICSGFNDIIWLSRFVFSIV